MKRAFQTISQSYQDQAILSNVFMVPVLHIFLSRKPSNDSLFRLEKERGRESAISASVGQGQVQGYVRNLCTLPTVL